MNNYSKNDAARLSRIKEKFDRVLKRHIRRLLDTDDNEPTPAYSLNLIACLLVLAEREREIAAFSGSPLKRYTRETFLKDLFEIGIDPDDSVMVEIQYMTQAGMIHIGGNDEYQMLEPANKLLSMLDVIFPDMQGLSLIAYILQSIDEVFTGRKDMMQAVRLFDETLLTRGQSVSKQRFETMRQQRAAAAQKTPDPSAAKKRDAYLARLRAIRERRAGLSPDPAIFTTTGFSTTDVEIRELFPKAAPAVQEQADEETEAQVPPPPPAEEDPPVAEAPPSPPPVVPEVSPIADPKPQVSEMAASPTEPPLETVPAEVPPAVDAVPPPPEPDMPEEDSATEDLIAKQIQAFEEQLAISCPMCKSGKIHSDNTERGKTYFHCTNENCNFVSWGKPHHLPCPECRNPFLIEFDQAEGGVGLKCPRATCPFQHRDFDGTNPPASPTPAGGKKVRKIAVRKKGGKGAVRRRVVRRKK